MPSTIPRRTVRINPLIQAIESNWHEGNRVREYPDSVLALLYAQVDPNNLGAPPVSFLGHAVRFHNDSVVEHLLEYRADTEYQEHGQELPLIQAVQTGLERCVTLLLRHRANPLATELHPYAEGPIRRGTRVRRRSAIEFARPHSQIAALLEAAIASGNQHT